MRNIIVIITIPSIDDDKTKIWVTRVLVCMCVCMCVVSTWFSTRWKGAHARTAMELASWTPSSSVKRRGHHSPANISYDYRVAPASERCMCAARLAAVEIQPGCWYHVGILSKMAKKKPANLVHPDDGFEKLFVFFLYHFRIPSLFSCTPSPVPNKANDRSTRF